MQDTSTNSPWLKRTFLGLPVVVWALMLTAGAALAVLGYVVVLESTGTISTGDGIDVEFVAGTANGDTNSGVAQCEASVATDKASIDIQANGLLPNEYCEITVDVTNLNVTGEPDGALQGFDIATGDLPADWSLTVKGASTDFCNTQIPAGGAPTTVGVRIVMGGEAASNTSYDLNTINRDGFRFVRSDLYDVSPEICF